MSIIQMGYRLEVVKKEKNCHLGLCKCCKYMIVQNVRNTGISKWSIIEKYGNKVVYSNENLMDARKVKAKLEKGKL